jgi:hypothetical protein
VSAATARGRSARKQRSRFGTEIAYRGRRLGQVPGTAGDCVRQHEGGFGYSRLSPPFFFFEALALGVSAFTDFK